MVRVFILCCLVFFVVWAFRVFFFLLFGRGRVFFFLLFGRGPRPRPNSPKKKKKKNTPPPKQPKKKKKRPRPFRACFVFCCLGGWMCLFFLFGRRACFFFAVWAGVVFFFLLFGRGRVLFLLFGRGRSFFCCLGRGRVFFLLFGRGTGVHSLTRLPGSSLSDPTTKETEQQKKTKTRVPSQDWADYYEQRAAMSFSNLKSKIPKQA